MNKAIFFDRDGVLIEAPTRNGKPKSIENISDIKKQISFSSSIIKTLYIYIVKNN